MNFTVKPNITEIFYKSELFPDWKKYENEKHSIFIFGYPFHCKQKRWVYPEDIDEWYQNERFDFLSEIDGFYTILILGQRNFLITDRYGVFTLFYKQLNNSVIISDSIKDIIDISGSYELNHDSLYEFLNFGYKIGTKTLITDIYEFDGGYIYSISNNQITRKKRYWNIYDNHETISDEQFRLQFNDRIELASKLESSISLPLTGGLDTRTILSACLTFKEQIHCYTHGESDFEDILLAKKISNHFNINYSSYSWDINWLKKLPELFEQHALMFNGNNDLFFIHVIESLKKEAKNHELFLSGALGNQLYRHHPIGSSLPVFDSLDEVSSFILERIPSVFYFRTDLSNYYRKLFNRNVYDDIKTKIKDNISSDIETATNYKSFQDLPEYYLFRNYTGNLASNIFKLTGKYLKVFGVFFHKDLLQQVHLQQLSYKTNGTIQKYIIKKNNEYLGKLNYVSNNRVLKYSKLISNLISNKMINKNVFKSPNLTNYSKWMKDHNPDFIPEILSYENMETKSFFNPTELDRIKQYYITDNYSIKNKKEILLKFSTEKFINNLLSLELWLKKIKSHKV